jgi:hypothetical protein
MSGRWRKASLLDIIEELMVFMKTAKQFYSDLLVSFDLYLRENSVFFSYKEARCLAL